MRPWLALPEWNGIVDDYTMVAKALWSVSSSPPMPGYHEYVRFIEACAPGWMRNPASHEALVDLQRVVEAHGEPAPRVDVLPWASRRTLLRRSVAALVSFVDDYQGPIPAEFFPERELARVLQALDARCQAVGRALLLGEQMRIALECTNGHVFGAVILLHAASRIVARGRDRRACPSLDFPLDERLRRGQALAGFSLPPGEPFDPPGDTYHYWATFAAGLHGCLARRRSLAVPAAVQGLFRLGPTLMSAVRGGIFGRALFCGPHRTVDGMGLLHGQSIGEHLLVEAA